MRKAGLVSLVAAQAAFGVTEAEVRQSCADARDELQASLPVIEQAYRSGIAACVAGGNDAQDCCQAGTAMSTLGIDGTQLYLDMLPPNASDLRECREMIEAADQKIELLEGPLDNSPRYVEGWEREYRR